MTAELKRYIDRPVSRETLAKLLRYAELLKSENGRQNLISKASLDELWNRHIADSAQLVRWQPVQEASWVDIGSGAGLPGIIIASLVPGPVTLVERRRLRAEFLSAVVQELALADQVQVLCAKAQAIHGTFDTITARAVGALDTLLAMTHHLSHPRTVWVLPKGRRAKSELADARRSWHCDATSEASLTDPESEILVLRNVRPKGRG